MELLVLVDISDRKSIKIITVLGWDNGNKNEGKGMIMIIIVMVIKNSD